MALPTGTFTAPGVEYYARAAESAQNWYKFPTQNGIIQMIDASGTQILHSIDANLFYNNELLAKAADIQDVADWSLYPALQTVELAGQNLTQVGQIDASSAVITDISSTAISTGTLAATGNITSGGTVEAGTLISDTAFTSKGTAALAGALVTGTLDMANNPVNRVSTVSLSNSGFAPYGALTSPDGALLTWNGASINTGAAGNAAQWANYPAVADVNLNARNITNGGTVNASNVIIGAGSSGNLLANRITSLSGPSDPPMSVTAYTGLSVTADTGSITTTAGAVSGAGNISTTAAGTITNQSTGSVSTVSNNYEITSDAGLSPLVTPNINLTAQNGNGGQINVIANPGSVLAVGGKISITANGGTVYVPQEPPAPPLAVTVGGEVDITANTGGTGLYTLTSAVKIGAAGVNSYAGAIPSVGSAAGYNFIYGTNGVNICSGLPSAGFQLPFTTYIYGVGLPGSYGGVRLQSPQGIQMLSDTYMTNLYPLDTDGLTIAGRSFLGTANVTIEDVASLTAVAGSGIIKTDLLTSVSNAGIIYNDNLYPGSFAKGVYANFLKPGVADTVGSPNLVISGNPNSLGTKNFVQIQNADSLAFDPAASGAITGVQSINGAAWPPPTGDAQLWAAYPAVQQIDVSGHGITACGPLFGVTDINGIPYVTNDTAAWATYPAVQNVDLSANGITQLASIAANDGFTLTSAGSIGIFADTSAGNISIATNGGGNVNIGTGNAGDITIQTTGAGNDLNLAGDTTRITAGTGSLQLTSATNIILDTPIIDCMGAAINNVINITGKAATTLTVSSLTDVVVQGATDAYLEATNGSANVTAQMDANMVATTGAVNITGATEIRMTAPNIYTVGALTGNSISSTNDVISSSAGSTPYSLNVVGGLVNTPQQYNYYVAVNGSDTTGTGSALRPFATITAALAATLSISDAIPINILIAAGTYTENPIVQRNNTFLLGNVGVADAVILGTLTFNPTATATVSQGMAGISVVGSVVCSDALSFDINWYFQYCNITSYTVAALTATSDGTGNNSLFMNNTVVSQNITANTTVALSSVRLNAVQCQLNNTTTGSCISANGTASMSLFGCTLTAAGAAAASPLVTFISFVANGTATSFQLCTFTYTASTVGAGKTAVFFNNGGALAGLTLFNQNVFNMLGSSSLILRPGIGSVAIQWGTNSSNILTIPAAGSGLTYTYLTSTPLRANILYDSASSAGTANQVLGAGAAGGTLTWRSLTNSSLGVLPAEPAATSYQNQLVFYNTATQSLAYGAADYQIQLITAPNTFAPFANQRGLTLIVTSAAAANLTLANTGLLTANDAGFFFTIKNGNGTLGGDITITGGITTGNTVIHNQTAVMNGGSVIVRWTGTAFVAY